jgi:hypothetical protein
MLRRRFLSLSFLGSLGALILQGLAALKAFATLKISGEKDVRGAASGGNHPARAVESPSAAPLASSASPASSAPLASPAPLARVTHSLLVLGDTQRTSWLEHLFLGREQHDRERASVAAALRDEILRGSHSALLLLGDHVCYGEDAADWRFFDNLFAGVRAAAASKNLPVFALLGNHDYGFVWRSVRATESVFERFPEQPRTSPALVRLPALLSSSSSSPASPSALDAVLLMLDSNLDLLSASEAQRQFQDYARLLRELDDDPSVGVVLVAAHHPLLTNSDLSPEQALVRYCGEPFLRSRKARVFLAGHVHAYERFSASTLASTLSVSAPTMSSPTTPASTTPASAKMLITSGGGGGPRRDVRIDAARRHSGDLFRNEFLPATTVPATSATRASTEQRPFHYLRLDIAALAQASVPQLSHQHGDASVRGEVWMLADDGTFRTFYCGEAFAV